ncbi:MAG: NUDIX domain-containing protein [Verrucomicrobia bacterium]|jgi:isopentenyl-diphosphate Delta-isomerase|nr:NUDIX domain-containing protein [Verrucomicrobiota bacterium]
MTDCPEEMFDVVNEQDEVIDCRSRGFVHANDLLHRAIHVLVFHSDGSLFLQKRSMLKDCFPGTWDSSASGHLDSGESYDKCAVREVEEELGWRPDRPLQKLFKIDASKDTGWEFVWIYQVSFDGPFTLHPEEIECGGWFSRDHVNQWLQSKPEEFATAFRVLWKRFLQWESEHSDPSTS